MLDLILKEAKLEQEFKGLAVIEQQLTHINGRVLYYDHLLATAQRLYKEYRDRRSDVSELDRVLRALDGEPPSLGESLVNGAPALETPDPLVTEQAD